MAVVCTSQLVIIVEHKKSDSSPLEEKRATGFLLGLVLVLSVLYVGFQYNSQPQDAEWQDGLLDELVQDIELHPAINDKEMMAAIPQQATSAVTERIRAIDKPTAKQPDKLSVNSADRLLVSDSENHTLDTKLSVSPPPTPLASDRPISFRIVEQMPEFPGGGSAFIRWLTLQLQYPPSAQSQKLQGKVIVSFIVNEDGSIVDVKLEKSVNGLLDREALRVIRMMPRWKPGKHHNQPCRTMVAVPVVFKL